MKKEENKKVKISLKEKLKDKRERAKIELVFYAVFFVVAIIFVRILSDSNSTIPNNNENNNLESFIYSIEDNYEYDVVININDEVYHYYGRLLGNNSTINLEVDKVLKKYYFMDKKYYILDDGNYILTNIDEVYPYIDYRYFNIDIIKEYLNVSSKENEIYIIKLKDILMNNEIEEYITMKIEEGDKNVVIDYTNLFRVADKTKEKVIVNITYNNIDNIISLEE